MITDIKVKEAGTSATQVSAMGLADGAIVSAKWIQSNIMLGNAFVVFTGVETTPGTFATSFTNTDPDVVVDIPEGTSIIPLKIAVYIEDFGSKEIVENWTLITKTLGAASGGTVFVPRNVRTRAAGGSNCPCYTAPTVTSGYTSGAFELCRGGSHEVVDPSTLTEDNIVSANKRDFIWTYQQDGFAPVIDGDGSLQTWAISQASKGYIHIFWLEFATADLVA